MTGGPTSSNGPLRSKYGGRVHEAINRAIRAECPGGNEAIDALTLLHQMCGRLGWSDGRGKTPLAVAYERVLAIVNAMDDEIRRRYGLPARPGDQSHE